MTPGRHPGIAHPAQGAGGPPMVLLHGFLGAPAAWDAVLAAMPDHGPAWCPWLPGHGPADPAAAPATWQQTVESLADALPAGALFGGYSLGARLALAASLARPRQARATLLVGGHVGLADPAERRARAADDAEHARALRGGELAAFVDAWEALPLFATQRRLAPDVQAVQRAWRLAHTGPALAWAFEVGGLAQMPDLRPAVDAAQQLLFFLTGELDARFGEIAQARVRPPWVAHRRVPGAGHNLLLEAPAAVAASLTTWMEPP